MVDTPPDDYRIQVELNQSMLEEELKGIIHLAQGAGAQAWDEITTLPADKQRAAIRTALKHITEEHGASAMLAAQDNMEAHVNMWARERGSFDGLPLQIEQSSPLGDKKLSKYTGDVYKRLQEEPSEAEKAFSRLLTATIMNRARHVVSNTCEKSKLRFYRIPERLACWFCLMLASRGAVYYSEYTAGKGHHYHAHCRCTVRAALPGEELHPVVKHLHENYGGGNRAVWQVRAENGELSRALYPYGYRVTKGKQKVTQAEIDSLRLKGDEIELYRRQKALYSKIPDGELLKQSEIEFLEAFEATGERVVWLPSRVLDDSGKVLPSNDFTWITGTGMEYELKSPARTHDGVEKTLDQQLKAVARRMTESKNRAYSNHGFEKTRFFIFLGDQKYDPTEDRWLSSLNKRPGLPKIKEITVFAGGKLHRLILDD